MYAYSLLTKMMILCSFVISSLSLVVTSNAQENVALGKSTSQSSTGYSLPASKAVDGKHTGDWRKDKDISHTNPESNPWWQVDLGAVYAISKIVIWNRRDCCWERLQGFHIMGAESPITANSTTESQLTDGPHSFTSAQQPSMNLSLNKRARYIRVFIPGDKKVLSLAEFQVFGTPAKEVADASASLVGRWVFATADSTQHTYLDETGNWKEVELIKGAQLTSRGLEVKKGNFAQVKLASGANLPGKKIKEKTLISWLIIDNIGNGRPAGSALTLDSKKRDQFDGIILGERAPNTWMAGSDYLKRSKVTGDSPKTTQAGVLVKMAITYKDKGGNAEVTIYQDDVKKLAYTQGKIPTWEQEEIEVIFGARHTIKNAPRGHLDATIVAAEIHNTCLSAEEIASRGLQANMPSYQYTIEMIGRRGGLSFDGPISAKPTTATIELYGSTPNDVKTYQLNGIWNGQAFEASIRDSQNPEKDREIFPNLSARVNYVQLLFTNGQYKFVGALKSESYKEQIFSGNSSTLIFGYDSKDLKIFPTTPQKKYAVVIRDKHASKKENDYSYGWYMGPKVSSTDNYKEFLMVRDDLLEEIALYEFENAEGFRSLDAAKEHKVIAYDLKELEKQLKVLFPKSGDYGLKTKLKGDIMALLVTNVLRRYPSDVFGLKSTGHGQPYGMMNEFLSDDKLISRSLAWVKEVRKMPIDFIDLNTNCNAGSYHNLSASAPYANYILASDLTRFPTNTDDYSTFFADPSVPVPTILKNLMDREARKQKECESCGKYLMQVALIDGPAFNKVVQKLGPDAMDKVREALKKDENKYLYFKEDNSNYVDLETAVPVIFSDYTDFSTDWNKVILKMIDNRSYANPDVPRIPEAKGVILTRN